LFKVSSVVALTAILALAGCAGDATLSPNQNFDRATQTQLEAALAESMAQKQPPGIVVRVDFPGRGSWTAAVGEADTSTHRPVSVNDHFRIGSVTKTFIGTMILQLVDEHRLSLDQKVDTLLNGVPNGGQVTIRMLLNMTSGIPSYSENPRFIEALVSDPVRPFSTEELLSYAYEQESVAPGTKLHYSNTNTILLGQILEKVTEKSISENLKERIYRRLGLKDTSWPTDNQIPAPYAHGYDGDPPAWTPVDATHWNPSWAGAAGQMISTLADLDIYARALGRGDLISPEMQQERLHWVTLPGPPDRKYGLAIGQTGGWTYHQGEIPGYNAVVAYLPSQNATVVILANTSIVPNPQTSTPVINLLVRISEILAPDETPITPIRE
jgi:D-alanyl-D-alanine carboxypeptidase